MFAIFVVIVEMILSHRSRRVSNLRKKSPDGHCLTGAFLYWNQWAGSFGHKGIESLGFRGHLTLDFPPIKATVIGRYSSYITVNTSDDASRNDGSFMFLILNINDWLGITN